MDPLDALKALSNPTRLQILSWLRDPHRHFPLQEAGDPLEVGVCVKDIQQKAGVSQSPTLKSVTASPAASTTPETSTPRVSGV